MGADGANSIVRRHLELPRESIVGWAYHFVVDQPATEFHIYWLPRTFPAGYGYMMSRSRGQTMVGLAFEGGRFDRDVAARAGAWVAKRFGLDVSKLRHEAAKGNADYRGWRFGNVFLVGEAAGLLNPLSTEGIYYAIRSGEGVGKFLRGDADGRGADAAPCPRAQETGGHLQAGYQQEASLLLGGGLGDARPTQGAAALAAAMGAVLAHGPVWIRTRIVFGRAKSVQNGPAGANFQAVLVAFHASSPREKRRKLIDGQGGCAPRQTCTAVGNQQPTQVPRQGRFL